MKIITDLHIHSRYSRGCSKDLGIDNLVKYARIKGVGLLGTGDFTHPEWIKEVKEKLSDDGNGVYKTKDGFPFILQTEISLIYSQGGKGRRVHVIILAPSLEVVGQITDELKKRGRVDYDGRPIFKISCIEFVGMMNRISNDIEVIPAHCLPPDSLIKTNPHSKEISKISIGERVLTHKGRFRRVKKVYRRNYTGKMIAIIPWYFREGVTLTPEHPLYAIKSFKKCTWTKGLCKPLCSQRDFCKRKEYVQYYPQWIQAKNLETGDFLLYPRENEVKDAAEIRMADYVNIPPTKEGTVNVGGTRDKCIPGRIAVDKKLCRLIGYYLAEGYTNNRDAVCFSFRIDEAGYISDVCFLMKEIFNVHSKKNIKGNGIDITFYSKALFNFFSTLFYDHKEKRAWSKCLPHWMLLLATEKQAEILRGWWRGDCGYTVSQKLAEQMKTLCLRLWILPSISVDPPERYSSRGKHIIEGRKIATDRDTIIFSNLSFFKDSNHLLEDACFRRFCNKRNSKHGWMDDSYAYLPIRTIKTRDYTGTVFNLEVAQDNSYVTQFATVHNCWTPWFSLFGSKSGFDSMKEAFGDQLKNVHAIETGLSSDPQMNWRLSQLDNMQIVSFSDLHSYWPWRIGREATILDLDELTYKNVLRAIRTGEGLHGTVEVNPAYGKYHEDGHRNCDVCLMPSESIKLKGICPKCHRPLTIGVHHRVDELADRPEGYIRKDAKKVYSLMPLHELLANVFGRGMATKKMWEEYYKIVKLGSEFEVLMNTPYDRLVSVTTEKMAKAIIKNREAKLTIKPGYDGRYGVPLFDENEREYAGPQIFFGEDDKEAPKEEKTDGNGDAEKRLKGRPKKQDNTQKGLFDF